MTKTIQLYKVFPIFLFFFFFFLNLSDFFLMNTSLNSGDILTTQGWWCRFNFYFLFKGNKKKWQLVYFFPRSIEPLISLKHLTIHTHHVWHINMLMTFFIWSYHSLRLWCYGWKMDGLWITTFFFFLFIFFFIFIRKLNTLGLQYNLRYDSLWFTLQFDTFNWTICNTISIFRAIVESWNQ